MSCQTCVHCDTNEATTFYVPGSVVRHVVVGICTLRECFFHANHVPDWLTGCVDYQPAVLAQGDGDQGE